MKTFAHVETGVALDPQVDTDAAAYRARFAPDVTQGWQVQSVPDGTVQGSTPDGHGGWTPPPAAPAPAPKVVELGGSEFHTYCATVLAQVNNTSQIDGMARLGDILNGLEVAAGHGGLCRIAFERYRAAGVPGGKYNAADAAQLMGALQVANVVTAQESAALLAGWPKK